MGAPVDNGDADSSVPKAQFTKFDGELGLSRGWAAGGGSLFLSSRVRGQYTPVALFRLRTTRHRRRIERARLRHGQPVGGKTDFTAATKCPSHRTFSHKNSWSISASSVSSRASTPVGSLRGLALPASTAT
ncbi:hypothetical protein QW131_11825 [Roseibium salinum]|nr:hypothetical protein [Roseibium salinum]